jgi:plasmid stabilization system protein ParE
MPFAVEFSAESQRDFELIFDHLLENYIGFGENPDEALKRAAHRIMGIRRAADRLATFPIRGTARDDVLPGVRYLTIDRAIYWFDVDEAARKVRILAIFFGGQDHVRHMLVRLLRKDQQG